MLFSRIGKWSTYVYHSHGPEFKEVKKKYPVSITFPPNRRQLFFSKAIYSLSAIFQLHRKLSFETVPYLSWYFAVPLLLSGGTLRRIWRDSLDLRTISLSERETPFCDMEATTLVGELSSRRITIT